MTLVYHISSKCNGLQNLLSELPNQQPDTDIALYSKLCVLLYADDTVLMSESIDAL